MKLYYTTSKEANTAQREARLSLGGVISSTPVPISNFNNLFGDITQYTIQNNDEPNYICLILKNETGGIATGVNVYFDTPEGSYSDFKIASIQLVDGQVERVESPNVRPFSIEEFFEATPTNKALLGDIPIDSSLALWFERSLNKTNINNDQNNFVEKDPENENLYRETEIGTSDTIPFVIEWT